MPIISLEDQHNEINTFDEGVKRRHRVDIYAIGPNNTILTATEYGYHDLPGGGVDKGETIIHAGLRELAEEAGWDATNSRIVTPEGNWVFSGKDDTWFNSDGWKEEANYAFICNTTSFNPTDKYGSCNDGLDFKLTSIKTFIEDINNSLNNNPSERIKLRLMFRLKVLNEIQKLDNIVFECNQPVWTLW